MICTRVSRDKPKQRLLLAEHNGTRRDTLLKSWLPSGSLVRKFVKLLENCMNLIKCCQPMPLTGRSHSTCARSSEVMAADTTGAMPSDACSSFLCTLFLPLPKFYCFPPSGLHLPPLWLLQGCWNHWALMHRKNMSSYSPRATRSQSLMAVGA